MAPTWPGAVVDLGVLAAAAWGAHVGLVPPAVFLGVIFTLAGARGALQGRGGVGGPKLPPGSGLAGSVVLILLAGCGAYVWHAFGWDESTA